MAATAALLLGWRPDEFWAATPVELAAILTLWAEQCGHGRGHGAVAAGMDAGAIAALQERFPDE
jgi:hypothetical protein